MRVTIRADSVELEGYVNAVGRDSRKLTDEYGYPFVEQIEPGTFAMALTRAKENEQEVLMLLDHDEHRVIGGTASNLTLEEDSIGLHAVAVVTDEETIRAAREKRLKGWSFGFRGLDFKENYVDGTQRRTITELDLVEVSVIDDRMTPAYAGTSIHARADDGESILYTRAMEDQVQYDGIEVQTEPDALTGDQAPAGEICTDANEARADPPDYSLWRNTIELLKLG